MIPPVPYDTALAEQPQAGRIEVLVLASRGPGFQFMGLPAGWVPEGDRVSETQLVGCVTPAERTRRREEE